MGIDKIKKDEIIRDGGIIFIASIIIGALSYTYQIYMGRILGPEEYGVLGAFFAIFYMIGIISQTLSTSVTRFISEFKGEGRQMGFFIKGTLKRMIILGFIISITFLIFAKDLASIFKLPDQRPIIVLILILFLGWIIPITDGILRGVKRFYILGITGISNASCKLVFGILFVTFGLGVSGALLGVALGMVFAIIVSLNFIKPYIRQNDVIQNIPDNPHIKKNIKHNTGLNNSTMHNPETSFRFSSFYSYSLPVMIAMFNYAIPANLDVILAKYYFSAVDAGIYTSVSVLGKIIFFFSGSIGVVMFSTVTEKYFKKEDTMIVLRKSLIYTGILSGSLTLIYIFFPQLIINKIFGNGYISAIPLLASYGTAMFFFSLVIVIMYYHLAIKNMRYIVLFTGFTILEITMFLIFHKSILEMANVLLGANFISLFGSILYIYRTN